MPHPFSIFSIQARKALSAIVLLIPLLLSPPLLAVSVGDPATHFTLPTIQGHPATTLSLSELQGKVVYLDFWASWCGPCKAVAPVLEEISEEYAGKVHVYKVNTEEEQEVAAAFGVRSIPSLLFVPMDGKPQMAVGALPAESFKKAISDIFKIPELDQVN